MKLISVIMPCFNHANFVKASADAILAQTYSNLELIIVDDCSRDDSWRILVEIAACDARVKIIRHEKNGGASRSRNDGLKAATGEFLGFCDADDIWETNKLERQMQLLEKNPTADVVHCDSILIDGNGLPMGQKFSDVNFSPSKKAGALFLVLVEGNFINMQTVLMRRNCLEKCGYFDETIKWVEDWDYWLRISQQHTFLYQSETLAQYRVHGASSFRTQRRGYAVNRFKLFRKILAENASLPKLYRSRLFYKMGFELCFIHKMKLGRQLMWLSVLIGIVDPRAYKNIFKALVRIVAFPKGYSVKAG